MFGKRGTQGNGQFGQAGQVEKGRTPSQPIADVVQKQVEVSPSVELKPKQQVKPEPERVQPVAEPEPRRKPLRPTR